MKNTSVKIIGLGGIGGFLVDPICRYLNYKSISENKLVDVTLIDGDSFEETNQDRQTYYTLAKNKAQVAVDALAGKFGRINFRAKNEYLTKKNVVSLIREDDIIFLGVDNHATRKMVSDRCEELQNVVLISGGNEYTDGNVIIYIRKDDQNVTKSPTELYESIKNPVDKNPGDDKSESCAVQQQSQPQLLFTNMSVASTMCNVYYAYESGKIDFNQVYLDIVTQRVRPK